MSPTIGLPKGNSDLWEAAWAKHPEAINKIQSNLSTRHTRMKWFLGIWEKNHKNIIQHSGVSSKCTCRHWPQMPNWEGHSISGTGQAQLPGNLQSASETPHWGRSKKVMCPRGWVLPSKQHGQPSPEIQQGRCVRDWVFPTEEGAAFSKLLKRLGERLYALSAGRSFQQGQEQ